MNGDRGVDESGVGVKPEIIIMLLVFYAIFVTGDVLTTFWLIEYHPGGINGEMNPIAYMIFTINFIKSANLNEKAWEAQTALFGHIGHSLLILSPGWINDYLLVH